MFLIYHEYTIDKRRTCSDNTSFGQNKILASVMVFEGWKVDYNFTLSFQSLATILYVIVEKK